MEIYKAGKGSMADFYRALEAVPKGCVVSYGQLAALAGRPKAPRMAGKAVSSVPSGMGLCCHRVVHSDGSLVKGWTEQRHILTCEGVGFLPSGKVDMKKFSWKVDIL